MNGGHARSHTANLEQINLGMLNNVQNVQYAHSFISLFTSPSHTSCMIASPRAAHPLRNLSHTAF